MAEQIKEVAELKATLQESLKSLKPKAGEDVPPVLQPEEGLLRDVGLFTRPPVTAVVFMVQEGHTLD